MNISKKDLDNILEFIAQAESFRPIVQGVLKALRSYADELREIPEALMTWLVKCRLASIAQYEAAGFDRSDAIIMTLDDIYAVKKLQEQINRHQGEKR